jgi:hypothetical protein
MIPLKKKIAGHQWLKPVILAIWETEIGRITIRGLDKKVHETHLNGKKLDIVVQACDPSDGRKHKIGRLKSSLAQAKNKILSQK